MNPFLSWGCVIAIGVGLWWYYYQSHQVNRTKSKNPPPPARRGQVEASSKREPKAKKEKASATANTITNDQSASTSKSTSTSVSNSTSEGKMLKRTKFVPPTPDTSAAQQDAENDRPLEDDDAEHLSNKAFAKHLSSLKTGTSLTRPAQDGLSKKARRANKQTARIATTESSGPSSSQEMSTNSSTTGADADDDLSPVASPPLSALSDGNTVKASGDVSDMLEIRPTGPSVLRLTGSTEPSRQRQQKEKEYQVHESKKRRQARMKNEERKMQLEEAEKQRRILLEKQLRTAREAENRAPRNGTSRPTPKDFNRDPWKPEKKTIVYSDGSTANVIDIPPELQGDPHEYNNPTLLDTFDRPGKSVVGGKHIEASKEVQGEVAVPGSALSPGPVSEKANGHSEADLSHPRDTLQAVNQPTQSWADDYPSEDEQLRRLSDIHGDDGWKTVGKKTKKKAPTSRITGDGTSNENSDAGNTSGRISNKPPIAVSYQEKDKTKHAAGVSTKAHPQDSDWAVA